MEKRRELATLRKAVIWEVGGITSITNRKVRDLLDGEQAYLRTATAGGQKYSCEIRLEIQDWGHRP